MSSIPHLKVQTGLIILAVPMAKTSKGSQLPALPCRTQCVHSLTAAALTEKGERGANETSVGGTVCTPIRRDLLQPEPEGAGLGMGHTSHPSADTHLQLLQGRLSKTSPSSRMSRC